MESKKILILTHKPPYPKVDGGCIAMAQFLELLLDLNHSVRLLSIETYKHPSSKVLNHPNLKFESFRVNTKINLLSAFFNLFKRESYLLSRFKSSLFREAIQRTLKREKFDIIVFESLYTSPYIDLIKKLSTAKLIYRSHNVEHLIWSKQKTIESNFLNKWYLHIQSNRLKKEELNFWNHIEKIASISKNDSDYMSKKCDATIKTIGLHIDEKFLKSSSNKNETSDFFHLGAMDWLPNQKAVDWLVNDIWPEFMKHHQEHNLHLAGRSLSIDTHQQQNVINHGEVDSAIDFMNTYNVMLIPLNSGSGIRVKIIEAMALSKCIICTSIAADGIPYTDEKNILIANDKEQFIKWMKFCINNNDLVKKIGVEAKKCVQEYFSKERISNELTGMLQ